MDKDPDETLAERCRRGERSALEAIVRRYQRPLYNAAFRVLGNADDASETTQTVFLRVWERIHEYDPQYRFFSWIYRIAVNESLSMLRRKGHEEPLDDEVDVAGPDGDDPERRAGDAELSARIRSVVMSMATNDRTVLMLRHFSDLSYQEIGQVLDLDEKTVKSRLFEARHRLRGLLGDLRGL